MLLTPRILLQGVLRTVQSVQPQDFKCVSGQFSTLFVFGMFLQYKGNKTLNFERPDLSCNFQISLKLTEASGQGNLFCFIQFAVMMLSSEALFNFSVCICMSIVIGIYRNQSLSKADCFDRLKATVKSVVSRAPGDFCTTSKRFLRNN